MVSSFTPASQSIRPPVRLRVWFEKSTEQVFPDDRRKAERTEGQGRGRLWADAILFRMKRFEGPIFFYVAHKAIYRFSHPERGCE